MFALATASLIVLGLWGVWGLRCWMLPHLPPLSVLSPDGPGAGPYERDCFGARLPLPRERWHHFNHGMMLVLFVLIAVLGAGWAWALANLASLGRTTAPGALEVGLGATWAIWAPCGLVLGLASSMVPFDLLLRYGLGARWGDYCHYEAARIGQERSGAKALALVTVPLAGAIFLGMGEPTRFEEDRLVVKNVFGQGEEVHAYADLEQIVQTTHTQSWAGHEREEVGVVLLFRDGRRWCSGGPLTEGREEEIMRYVKDRTGKTVVILRTWAG